MVTNLTSKEHMHFDVAIVAEQAPDADIKLVTHQALKHQSAIYQCKRSDD